MDKDQRELKKFLEQQLLWNIEQARILDEINVTLHKMKELAEYASIHELSPCEMEKLNGQMDDLKNVVQCLEGKYHSVIH